MEHVNLDLNWLAPEHNWANLARTVEHFSHQGFIYIEVPWLVPAEVTAITAPHPLRGDFSTPLGDLVGSAEQSFIHLLQQGQLPKGRYVTLSPCFREEKVHNHLKRPWFMKVELIAVGENATTELTLLCRHWFETLSGYTVDVVTTDIGLDLELGGIELGSYGYRTHNNLSWTYATGLAEPRFSQAVKQMQQKEKNIA